MGLNKYHSWMILSRVYLESCGIPKPYGTANSKEWSPMVTFNYFAYGSNMLTERLKKRCPSSTKIGLAYADDRIIEFSKPSMDKSGKATLRLQPGNRTPGVLFRIRKTELAKLDRYEGAGKGKGYYRCDQFPVHLTENDEIVYVKTYLASCAKSDLKPYDWYLALVIAGVCEHGLDDNHLEMLRCMEYLHDSNCWRRERRKAVEVFKEIGILDYRCFLGPA